MRFIGLTLCLLASTFGARADSLEDRVTALELRVKVLEDALHAKAGATAAADIDGTYKATMPNGSAITATFDQGKVAVVDGAETKTATYTVADGKVFATGDGKTESLTIDGNHLRTDDSNRIDFQKTTPGNATPAPTPGLEGTYQGIIPNGGIVNLELANGKATASVENDSKSGTYEVTGGQVVITIDGKAKTFTIEGDHLKSNQDRENLDFRKTK
ncbi:MAG TPA: hypothetical protein VGM54_06440 [Chthoniobacter sp.]|jgi:hypothetical protein